DFPQNVERVRRRPAICSWRGWLRCIACHDQRPLLVRPAKEKVLTELEQFDRGFPSWEAFHCAASRASKKSSPHYRKAELTTDYTDNMDRQGPTAGRAESSIQL